MPTFWAIANGDEVNYAKFRSRSHGAVIRVYESAGNVIETHEHKGDFKEPWHNFLVTIQNNTRFFIGASSDVPSRDQSNESHGRGAGVDCGLGAV